MICLIVYDYMIFHHLRSANSLEIGLPDSWTTSSTFSLLSYCLTEEVGKMWTLQCKWLCDCDISLYEMETPIQAQRESDQWVGYVKQWQSTPFQTNQYLVEIEIEPHHPHQKHHLQWKSIPRQRGIHSLLKGLGFDVTQWVWTEDVEKMETPQQWLLLNESAWQCLHRFLKSHKLFCTWLSRSRQYLIHSRQETPRRSETQSTNALLAKKWTATTKSITLDWTSSSVQWSLGDLFEQNAWIHFREESCYEESQQIGIGKMRPLQCLYRIASPCVHADSPSTRGLYWGQIMEQNGSVLNAHGQYQVRILNEKGSPTDAICQNVSLVQAHSHTQGGIHIPLHPQSIVLLLFTQFHYDEPVLMGCHPSWGGCTSPVTDKNSSESIWQTPLGLKLSFTDKPNLYSKIQLQSPRGFFWHYNDEKRELKFGFEQCHFHMIQHPPAVTIQVKDTQLQLLEDKIDLRSNNQIQSNTKQFQVQSSEDISLSGNQSITLQSNQIMLNSL